MGTVQTDDGGDCQAEACWVKQRDAVRLRQFQRLEPDGVTYDFDLLTIVAGSGVVAGSRRAASYGVRVAMPSSRTTRTDRRFDCLRHQVIHSPQRKGRSDTMRPDRSIESGWLLYDPGTVSASPISVDQSVSVSRKSVCLVMRIHQPFSAGKTMISVVNCKSRGQTAMYCSTMPAVAPSH
jgi:hypothetical protein